MMPHGATRCRTAPNGVQNKKNDSGDEILDSGVFGHVAFEIDGHVSLSGDAETIGSQSGNAGKKQTRLGKIGSFGGRRLKFQILDHLDKLISNMMLPLN
jgi:hypothetical protein